MVVSTTAYWRKQKGKHLRKCLGHQEGSPNWLLARRSIVGRKGDRASEIK